MSEKGWALDPIWRESIKEGPTVKLTNDEPLTCPRCESTSVWTTLIGPIGNAADRNRVECSNCKWRGTAQDWKDIANLKLEVRSLEEELKYQVKQRNHD